MKYAGQSNRARNILQPMLKDFEVFPMKIKSILFSHQKRRTNTFACKRYTGWYSLISDTSFFVQFSQFIFQVFQITQTSLRYLFQRKQSDNRFIQQHRQTFIKVCYFSANEGEERKDRLFNGLHASNYRFTLTFNQQ